LKRSKVIILGIIIILILELSIYFVAGTFSRYVSTAESSSSVRTAKWAVMLGNVDLAGGEKDFSSELTLETTNSSNVATGTIAPNTSVQGSFTINPNGTEVAMKYTISLGTIYYKNVTTGENVTENTPNIKVSNITVSTGELTQNTDGTYSGNIDLDGQEVEITIPAEWESTNDENDTLNGYEPVTVVIPVTVTVEQNI
jgi:hypothetical protein